jgi:hypothetical protein
MVKLKAYLNNYFYLIFSGVLFVASFMLRLIAYGQTPYANGSDSYFYLIQIKGFMEEGSMHSSDVSLIYPLMISIQWLSGDYVLSYKITCALLAGIFSVLCFLFCKKWSRRKSASIVLGCFTLFSPHLTYFAGQYPKNMLGLILFVLLIMYVNHKKILVPLAILLLNFFGHRLTAILSICYGVLYVLLKKKPTSIFIGIVAIFIVFLLAGIFLPGILSFADLERFENTFSLSPHFSPFTFINTFGQSLLSPFWEIEIVFVCVLQLMAIAWTIYLLWKKKADPLFATLTTATVFLIFPFLHWSMESIGYRLFLVYVLITPLLISYSKNIFSKHMGITIGGVLVVCSIFSYKSYNPDKHDPPYKLYEIISKRTVANVSKDSIELIIAHKSLAEFLTFTTGLDAMPWIPEYPIDDNKLWRIATGLSELQLKFYLKEESNKGIYYRLSSNYFLIKEKDWKMLMQRIQEDKDMELLEQLNTWRNPSKVRPYYLLKNK